VIPSPGRLRFPINVRVNFNDHNPFDPSDSDYILGAALSASCPILPAQSAANQVFDGTWNVTVDCAKAPDGALPYSWLFPANVRRGTILGHYQKPETIPSGTLSGQIGADGDALLIMED